MKQVFFTPGPSQLYPTIAHHIADALREDIGSLSHRSEKFQDIFKEAVEGVRKLLAIPEEYSIVFVASGTEAMERIVENTVEKKSFHFVHGSFSERWYETAIELQKDAQMVEVDFGKGFEDIPEIPKDTELICFTQNETSSGVAINPEFIYNVKNKNPHALIAVDIVSSAPFVDLDYTKLDCVFFSVQKLFGLPAGLGVMILSPKALEKAQFLQKKGISIGTYHNFPTLVEWAKKNQTLETPNVLYLYLLGKVAADMNKKGIQHIRKDIEKNAKRVYDFFDNQPLYQPFVTSKKDRSQTVIVITLGDKTDEIKKKLQEQGLIVGGGYGPRKKEQIRIANFPSVEGEIERLLNAFAAM